MNDDPSPAALSPTCDRLRPSPGLRHRPPGGPAGIGGRRAAGFWLGVLGVVATPAYAALPEGEVTRFRQFVAAQAAPRPPPDAPVRLAPLRLEVTVDGETDLVPALVRITSVASGKTTNLPGHLRRQMGWYSLGAGATVMVPAGAVRVEACRGLDTEVATATVEAGTGSDAVVARVRLRRFYDAAARGWRGGNTHLHLRYGSSGGTSIKTKGEAEEYLATVGGSDALDLVYVSYLLRSGFNYVTNELDAGDLARLSRGGVAFVNGEEFRHEGGRSGVKGGKDELRYGHVLMLDLPRLVEPVSYGAIFTPGRPPSDAQPLRRGMQEARQLGATLIWCHGRQGLEDVPNWIAGMLDAQNIFDGGSEGTYERVFYPYLNAGLRVPFSTGTDWGVYDFSRVYVATKGPARSAEFLAGLRAGRSYITNGPLLEFEVEGLLPGDTLDRAAPGPVRVRGRVVGREDFGAVELIWNGEVVARADRREAGRHFEAELATSIEVSEPGWLALRTPMTHVYSGDAKYTGAGANLLGKALFAHTSPVYVRLAGAAVRKPEAVAALHAELAEAEKAIAELGAFADAAEREAVLTLYRQAHGVGSRR